jgi:hypothetical protein
MLLPLLFFITLNGTAQIRKINAETSVQQVTIFSLGAQVHRVSQVSIPAGRSEIIFTELSSQLQQQSVQLKAEADITLIAVQTQRDYFNQRKIEQDERDLIKRKDEIKEKNEADSKLLTVYKNEEQMLIKNQSIGGTTGVKAEDLKQALDLHRARLTEVFQKQSELEGKIKQQVLELERVTAQLSEISKKKDSIKYTVVATVESKSPRNLKMELSYSVKDAGWYPTYDVRVTDIQQPLKLLMKANVFQRSGETWKDVSIQLSSGNPTDNATPSQLHTWWIGYYDPSITWSNEPLPPSTISGRVVDDRNQPITGATIMLKGTASGTTTDANGFFKLGNVPSNATVMVSYVGYEPREVVAKPGYYSIALRAHSKNLQEVVIVGYGTSSGTRSDYDASINRKQQEDIKPVSMIAQYQPTTTIYKIEEKYTLETDGKTTTINMKNIEIGAQYQYFCAPKLDHSVYLSAKITNWQNYDLQPGEANLYFEGTYLGKTYMDLSNTEDTLQLSLGKDNSIIVNRKLVKEFSSKKFIGSNKTESRRFEIAIRNTKRSTVNLILQDQFPISNSKEIDVNETRAPDAQVDKETGIATWNLSLPAGQEKKLQLSYEVKYPKDRRVVLN